MIFRLDTWNSHTYHTSVVIMGLRESVLIEKPERHTNTHCLHLPETLNISMLQRMWSLKDPLENF